MTVFISHGGRSRKGTSLRIAWDEYIMMHQGSLCNFGNAPRCDLKKMVSKLSI